jgi:hypothetical protein
MEALAGGGVWIGMVIGFGAGMAFQAARQAIQTLRKTQESIPALQKTAALTRVKRVVWLLVVAGYAGAVLWVVTRF